MRVLDRYLLVEWLKALGLAVGATLAVLVLEDMYSNLGDLLADGAHGREVEAYYRMMLPGFLPAVLPMSQLVALLFAVGNLHRHQEITAMRAAGLSLWRIARPLWIGGAVLAALLGWFDAVIVPASVKEARTFRDNLHLAAERRAHPDSDAGIVGQLTYDNVTSNRFWFINRFNKETHHAYGILINELDQNGHDQRAIYAHDGYFDDAASHWVLNQGRVITFNADHSQLRSLPFETNTPFSDLPENPVTMLNLRQDAKDLSLDELGKTLTQAPSLNPAVDSFAVQYYTILSRPLICLLVVGLAVPFAVAGVRASPMVGASKAVGLFFAYYLVTGLSTHLGDQHFLPAFVAAWLPIAAMLGLSLWLFRRAA
jgi:lipopolysaccharide export system permease protein